MRRPLSTVLRWPLIATNAPQAERRTWLRVVAASLALLLLGASLLTESILPVLARVALAAVALVPLVYAALARHAKPRSADAFLQANEHGLSRLTPATATELCRWESPFGVCLLASYGRPVALLAFTTPAQTRYVPVRIDGRSDDDDDLFARIGVLADLDLVDGVAHEAALPAGAAAEVLRLVGRRQGEALGRVFMSDGRGAPIALDRATLSVGDRSFDLTSPLEWRAVMFHESAGQGAALYQATSIVQGPSHVVLVAPMPSSIIPRDTSARRDAAGRLGRALTRDLKLLHAPAESPPPRELRVAIDRPFMMAVRHALADAPLATKIVPEPAPRPRTARRDSLA
jgi:hypothetical protein